MSLASQSLVILALIAASAFFSISELSLAAARRIKLTVLADGGDARAREVLALQDRPGHFFTAIQIGLNTVAILAGVFGESALTPYFQQALHHASTAPWAESAAQVLSFLTITALFIVFADLLPKRLAMLAPERVALATIGPMRFFIAGFKPAVWCFNGISDWLLRLLGIPELPEDDITFADISAVVDAGAEAGVLPKQEYHLIENVFGLESRLVPSAMTTRESIVYFTVQDSEADIRAQIAQHSHSKFLVCDDVIDRVVGYADTKDLLTRLLNDQPLSPAQGAPWIKPVMTVPDSLTLYELLDQFRANREDFAVVLNEYALVVGLITLNDVMSTVMGDLVIASQQQIVKRDDHSWLVDGLTPVEDVMRALEISTFPDDSNYETIAGFMMYRLRKMPKLTDSVIHAGYKFEVVDLENHRIDQLLVTRLPDHAPAPAA
ncbi:MAG TPA: hemolysin family protein [Moraxellaceae bacterium]|nr:hemolysin family protein [Moraxellaceae bacterium]